MPSIADYQGFAAQSAAKYGVDPATFLGLIQQESSWNPIAQPRKKDGTLISSAFGFTQLLKDAASDMGVDRHDPMQNIDGGARYLSQMLQKFGGNYDTALAAYFQGPGSVARKGINSDGAAYAASVKQHAKSYADHAAGSGRDYLKSLPGFNSPIFGYKIGDVVSDGMVATGSVLSAPGDAIDKLYGGLNLNGWLGRIAIIIFALVFIAAGVFTLSKGNPVQGLARRALA